MKNTHRLEVRTKSGNRLHLKADFEIKADAHAASLAILRANPDRFSCKITFLAK